MLHIRHGMRNFYWNYGKSHLCVCGPNQKVPPWKARKQQYLAHLTTASPQVKLVSAADKLHSVRAILSEADRHIEILLVV